MISIPSKEDKATSQLRDSLRILAWQQYKIENTVSGLEAYQKFADEWSKHEIQKYNMKELSKLIDKLGYTHEELMDIRSEYYQNRNKSNSLNQETNNNPVEVLDDNVPY